jgi:hypothetical protein
MSIHKMTVLKTLKSTKFAPQALFALFRERTGRCRSDADLFHGHARGMHSRTPTFWPEMQTPSRINLLGVFHPLGMKEYGHR